MYKLIAIDLDGTLLNSYGEVSEENANAIKKAIENGIEVVLASGRVYSSVKNIAKEIGAENYIISGNGSLVYDMKKDEIIYDQFMDKKKVLDIIRICDENSIYYNIYTEDTIIAKSINYNVLFYQSENSKKSESKKTKINIVENIYKYVEESPNIKILKITVCDSDKIIFSGIVRKIKTISKVNVLDISHMSRKIIKHGPEDVQVEYYYTEVSNENVDKWTAIKFLTNKLEIDENEVVAIGDNANDKQMVMNAGLGIAMGNSMLDIQKIGDYKVADNNSDGVAEAINKYILS